MKLFQNKNGVEPNAFQNRRIFSKKDYLIVRKAVAILQGTEQSVVVLRFWNQNTLDEIAEILDLTWKEVEFYLNRALRKLKDICLKDEAFSRNQMKGDLPCLNLEEGGVFSRPIGKAA